MSKLTSPKDQRNYFIMEVEDKVNKWIWENYDKVEVFRGEYLAINSEKGIIVHSKDFKTCVELAGEKNIPYTIYKVRKDPNAIYILPNFPIKLKSVKKNVWQPEYRVKIFNDENYVELELLVDSGADITVINYDVGQKLGLSRAPREVALKAYGIVGSFDYLLRELDFAIDEHKIKVTVAWAQDSDIESLLGREDIFDNFFIEFQGKNRLVKFKFVGNENIG
jgi:hypothetical protein